VAAVEEMGRMRRRSPVWTPLMHVPDAAIVSRGRKRHLRSPGPALPPKFRVPYASLPLSPPQTNALRSRGCRLSFSKGATTQPTLDDHYRATLGRGAAGANHGLDRARPADAGAQGVAEGPPLRLLREAAAQGGRQHGPAHLGVRHPGQEGLAVEPRERRRALPPRARLHGRERAHACVRARARRAPRRAIQPAGAPHTSAPAARNAPPDLRLPACAAAPPPAPRADARRSTRRARPSASSRRRSSTRTFSRAAPCASLS